MLTQNESLYIHSSKALPFAIYPKNNSSPQRKYSACHSANSVDKTCFPSYTISRNLTCQKTCTATGKETNQNHSASKQELKQVSLATVQKCAETNSPCSPLLMNHSTHVHLQFTQKGNKAGCTKYPLRVV